MTDVEAIKAAQPGVEVHVYGGGHGFGCDERGSYVEADYAVAQRRTLDFFAKRL
jgi:carboxymethylenebutenolidase